MRPNNPAPPNPVLQYRNPPRSGNAINGLGEERWRRASKVFHRPPIGSPDREPQDWARLDYYFNILRGHSDLLQGLAAMRHVIANRWQLRRGNGPVAPEKVQAGSPQAMARRVREFIISRYPDALVGFTEFTEDAVYEKETLQNRNAVCIGYPMNREIMTLVPHPRASKEVMRVYRKVSRIAVETSEFIRGMGWPAKAYGETKSTEVLHIPLAIQAGLGELGKHGSIISKAYGSNFRLSTVLTDLPLALDRPVDIGVDDLCSSCRRCQIDCPPQALFDSKQLVRGQWKWYVDFDKCIYYFVENGGCAICLEVCPWSEPGRGSIISGKLLSKRADKKSRLVMPSATPGG